MEIIGISVPVLSVLDSELLGEGAAILHVHLVPHVIEFQSLLIPLCVFKIQRMSNRKRHLSAHMPWEQ